MSEQTKVDLSEDRLYPLGWGFIFRCACAPKSWSGERVSEQLTSDDPPGTMANHWVISEPDNEREGPFKGVNNVPCPDDENRVHWLLNC